MTLVAGATGYLGSRVCRALAEAGKPVTALVRAGSEGKLAALGVPPIDTVHGDLKDPASLRAACEGQDAVVSTASSSISRQSGDDIRSVDLDGQIHLIDAARSAGVGQLVYISFSGNLVVDAPLTAAKREVEAYLAASGVPYTILRCAFLMDVMLSPACGFDAAGRTAVLYGTGDAGVSWLAMDDVADVVARAIGNPDLLGSVLELGGPDTMSLAEVVATFEEVTGQPFTVQKVPEDVLRAQLDGAADPIQQSLAALMLDYATGDALPVNPTIAALGGKRTTVRQFASSAV